MRCNTLALLTVLQVLLNKEVILTDICIVQFMIACCLLRSLPKHVEQNKLIFISIAFGVVNFGWLWVPEKHIQTCKMVFKGLMLLTLVMIYQVIESKIAKYKKKLEAIREARRKRFAR